MNKIHIWFSLLAGLSSSKFGFARFMGNGDHELDIEELEPIIQYSSWYGADGCRVLPYCQWWCKSREEMLTPYYYDPKKRHFDLTKPNVGYWREVGKFAELLNKYGMLLCYNIFDCCGLLRNQPNRMMNPWFNNKQGVKHWLEHKSLALKTAKMA